MGQYQRFCSGLSTCAAVQKQSVSGQFMPTALTDGIRPQCPRQETIATIPVSTKTGSNSILGDEIYVASA